LVPEKIFRRDAPFAPKSHRFEVRDTGTGIGRIVREALALRRIAAREGARLLRFHSVRYHVPVLLLLRLFGVRLPCLIQHHHVENPVWLYALLLHLGQALGAKFVAVSEFSRRELLVLGLKERNCFGIPNVLPYFPNELPPRAEDPDELGFAFVGSLIERKHPDLALRAAAGLASRQPRLAFCFTFVGNGPLLARLKEIPLPPNLRAEFVSHAGDEEKFSLLRRARFFLFPSEQEGFGFAALEAALCGSWVLACPAAALPETLAGLPNVRWIEAADWLAAESPAFAEGLAGPAPEPSAEQRRTRSDASAWGAKHTALLRQLL
jgi:glycosyltransferase involved in cell wall biosynthesis